MDKDKNLVIPEWFVPGLRFIAKTAGYNGEGCILNNFNMTTNLASVTLKTNGVNINENDWLISDMINGFKTGQYSKSK